MHFTNIAYSLLANPLLGLSSYGQLTPGKS